MKLKDFVSSTVDNRGRNPEKYYEIEQYPVIDNYLIKNSIYPDMSAVNRYIDQNTFDHFLRGYVHKNMPIMTLVGNGIGNVTLAPSDDVVIIQNTIGFECNDKIDEVFLYYYLLYRQEFIRKFDRGSGQPSIRKTDLLDMEVNVPNISKQKRIREVLCSIDEKIENNNAINNNLERQADALYQTFFSPKSGTQGKVVTLDKYCSIFTGKKNANASVNGGKYKFFTCAPEALQIDSYIFDGNAIIVSGNGAYTGRTRFYSGKFDLYQRTYACTLLDNVNPDFIFPLYWFVKLELSKKIMGGTRGSAIPYIVMNDLAKFEFIYNEEMFANYTPLFKSLTEAIQANEFESENLAQIRDSLLPKLMSGELDVSDIEL